MKSASLLRVWAPRLVMGAAILAFLFVTDSWLIPTLSRQNFLNAYNQVILAQAGIAIILAVSLNLINGITGQFSLGHAGFMAIGAYVGGYFTKELGQQLQDPISFSIGLLLAAAAAGLAGLVVGLPSLRLRGDYLAIVTLGFNQIIISLIRNIPAVGGASGYPGIPKFTSIGWTFGLVFLCILSVRNLASSTLGRSMRAVRDDEIAAEAAGINTTQIKVLAFVFSAMWAGVAGALYSHLIQTANPADFTFTKSVEVVVSVVLGGLGSITGSALAGFGLKVLEEVMRSVSGVFWISLILIALVAFWTYQKNQASIKQKASNFIAWLTPPTVALIIVVGLYVFANPFLTASRGFLRYILYSIILIVLMLVRPQGLLGRSEWSLKRRGRDRKAILQA